MISLARNKPDSIRADSRIAWSPAWWPNVSLTCLKLSRSRINSAQASSGKSAASRRRISRSIVSRLSRPDSASRLARRSSSSRRSGSSSREAAAVFSSMQAGLLPCGGLWANPHPATFFLFSVYHKKSRKCTDFGTAPPGRGQILQNLPGRLARRPRHAIIEAQTYPGRRPRPPHFAAGARPPPRGEETA